MATRPVADLIDELLASRKTLGGTPDWHEGPYSGEERLVMPLLIDGVSTGAELLVTAYPYHGHGRFRIMIIAEKCVWRLDYVFDEPHVNSLNRPKDIEEYDFCEPHYHAWKDNSRFSTHQSLPESLHNARIMPAGVRSFDSSLRWFCGLTNIDQPPVGLIALPPRRRLL